MASEEILQLENTEIAQKLNDLLAAGKTKDEAEAELGLTAADLMKVNVFFVKDKYMARAWSGYTSTKRSGNEYKEAEGGGWRNDAKDFKGRSL